MFLGDLRGAGRSRRDRSPVPVADTCRGHLSQTWPIRRGAPGDPAPRRIYPTIAKLYRTSVTLSRTFFLETLVYVMSSKRDMAVILRGEHCGE